MLLIKPEKPDFFLSIPDLGSLVSSEYLLGLMSWFSPTRGGAFSLILSPAVKLADCRNCGLTIYGGLVCDNCGGGGRRKVFGVLEDFVESM